MDKTMILPILLIVCCSYLIWIVMQIRHPSQDQDNHKGKTDSGQPEKGEKRGEIMGKSKFVLRHSLPQAATEPEPEKYVENHNTFAASDVPKHPIRVPDDELDEAFSNPPLDIDYPLEYEDYPDEADEEDEEYEELSINGSPSLAQGVSFENMGEAFRTVVHNPTQTEKEEEETGRVLLDLKHTDMFEALVSGNPEREKRVGSLIDSYLAAFKKRQAANSPEQAYVSDGSIPADFNVRDIV